MPCDNTCTNYLKAKANGVVSGYRVMVGEEFCRKAKRKLTANEAQSTLAPEWCPINVDKPVSVPAKSSKVSAKDSKVTTKNPAQSTKAKTATPIPATTVPAPTPKAATRPAAKSTAGRVQEMVARLNQYRDEYYNKNTPSVSDEAYDRLFDELKALEQETGFVMSNSPTQTVGYKVVSSLPKIQHPIPLLSLDKTKETDDIIKFAGNHQILMMHKLDGLTIKLEYENGELVCASTRGDGDEGEDVTHNAPAVSGIPQRIPHKQRLTVVGEAFIHSSDFEILKATLRDSTGKPYKNARNLAAGSIRNLDAAECAKRRLFFTPFSVQEGLDEDSRTAASKFAKLNQIAEFGFAKCEKLLVTPDLLKSMLEQMIAELKMTAERDDIPIDGLVCTYNDIEFSKSCGRTGHHYKDGIAFKFDDDLHETVFRSIEWSPTRTGEISMVAIFDPVEIDGCEVSRATLHNLTFIKELELAAGCRILVSKRNMIIPHVEDNLDRGSFSDSIIPAHCPCCGGPTKIKSSDEAEKLFCDNPDCSTQRLRQFVHFTSKKAMNITGLSKATLEQFIARGWLYTFMDVYHLDRYRGEIVQTEGFGEKSYDRLWDAIQSSRITTFERYLISMDIPMIGRTASRELCRQFGGCLDAFETAVVSGYDFTQLPDFGNTLHQNIHEWFGIEENRILWKELQKEMTISNTSGPAANDTPQAASSAFAGKTIVATGKFIAGEKHISRDALHAKIVSLGAVPSDSVSKKTDFLVVGENAGSKLEKARGLGVTVLSVQEFLDMAGEA